MQRIAACIFDGQILIFHFQADFQTLVRQENRSHRSLREAPLAPPIAGIFFFEEPVHRPFDTSEKFLSEKQAYFVGIWNLGRTTLLLLSSSWGRRHFFMPNGADSEFVFGEDCWIERNF